MWRRFPNVRLTDAAVLEPERSGIGAVVESGLNLIAAQNVVTILSPLVAHQLSYGHLIGAVTGFQAQKGAFWRVVGAELNVVKGGLSQSDYVSKTA